MSYASAMRRNLYYRAPYGCKNMISSLYGWLQSRQRYGKFYENYLNWLIASQWYPNSVIQEMQFRAVKDFLIHAMEHSAYHRAIFSKYAFRPQTLKSLAAVSSLPILDKRMVRDSLQEIIVDNLKVYRPRWAHTSGTTGMGLRFPLSQECFQREYAFRYFHYLVANIRQGDKLAFCFGHPVTEPDRQARPFWVYDYCNNWLLFSSYHMTQRNLPHYIDELKKFEPALISGYPSSLYLLALGNDQAGRPIHPQAVYTASETLFDFQRAVIEKSFGCKAYMWYGNSEMCANIIECDKGRYHLKAEHSYVELLNSEDQPVQPGCEGRLICTGFGNYAMPLIRYNIGDVAIPAADVSCECGRSGQLIDRVIGRQEDYILTPDGRYVGRLDHLFKDAINVKMAQIIQTKIDEIIIRIVRERTYKLDDELEIMREARLRLGSGIDIKFEYVDDIARHKNGKHQFIVTKITANEIASVRGLDQHIGGHEER